MTVDSTGFRIHLLTRRVENERRKWRSVSSKIICTIHGQCPMPNPYKIVRDKASTIPHATSPTPTVGKSNRIFEECSKKMKTETDCEQGQTCAIKKWKHDNKKEKKHPAKLHNVLFYFRY